jgi:hypothetical protein
VDLVYIIRVDWFVYLTGEFNLCAIPTNILKLNSLVLTNVCCFLVVHMLFDVSKKGVILCR